MLYNVITPSQIDIKILHHGCFFLLFGEYTWISLSETHIGFNGQFYTLPYFLAFLLKRFLRERG